MASNNEWITYKIEDLGEVVGGGTPSTKKSEYFNGEIPWITPKDLSNFTGTYIGRGERNISKQGLQNSSAKLLPKDTVLLSSRAPIGYLAIAANKLTTNQGFKSIICNEDIVLPFYLFYSLKNDIERIKTLGTGSTFSELSGKAVKQIELGIPSIKTQKKVVDILKNIDYKIEINRNTIANLEELSQTLFKRWFIDFEFPDENGSPYKSSKGKMKKSSIGEIPAHWEITDIQEMTTKFTTGLNPRKNFTLGEGSNYYVTIKNMGNNDIILDERCDKVTDEAIEIINKRSDLQVGDVLFSGIGTIGRTYLIYKDPHNWNTSESIFSLRPSDKISSVYLYNLLLSEGVQDYSVQMSSGSVQKGIRKRDLERYTFALSNDNIEDYFEELVSPLQNKIHNLRDENLKLVELRDTLLPKLMSGEIELPDELEVDEHAELLQ